MTDAPTKPGSTTPAIATPSLGSLRQVLDANHRRWTALNGLRLVSVAAAVPLVYFLVVVIFEISVHLDRFGRLLACAGLLAGVAWSVYYLVRGRHALRHSEDELALAMEERTGRVGNRLINAVQLSAGAQNSPLHAAVVEENVTALRSLPLQSAASARPALWAAAIAALLLAVGAGVWVFQKDRFTNAAARIVMPLAHIDPLYRTTLAVEPGDITQLEDVAVTIAIDGEHPGTITVTRVSARERTDDVVPVPPGVWTVKHVIRGAQSGRAEYWVRGNDFRSPTYTIGAPEPFGFATSATYRYPDYTKLPPKTVAVPSGELEAVEGAEVSLAIKFSQPVTSVDMGLETGPGQGTLSHSDMHEGRDFSQTFKLEKIRSYSFDVTRAGHPRQSYGPFAVRILADQEPQLELSGLERSRELAPDAEIPLKISASDDFGVAALGLFYRPLRTDLGAATADEPWREIKTFPCDGSPRVRGEHRLKVADIGAAEGDRIEIAVRAKDTYPGRKTWTQGPTVDVVVGGEGAGLQIVYEQLLKSGKDLAALAGRHDDLARPIIAWQRKLEGEGDLRWDDPKNLAELHKAIAKLETDQDALRKDAGKLARAMPEATGSLRLSVGLLADTEMVRVHRILGSVPTRETPALKQAALADAKVTLDRIGRSLDDIREQYTNARQEWERSHMIAFAKLLADRQAKLNVSATAAKQRKVLDVAKLIAPAFVTLGERTDDGPDLAAAYRHGADVLGGDAFASSIKEAADALDANRPANVPQAKASEMLTDVYQRLKRAQVEAARKALAALRERAKTDPKAKAEIEDLPEGLKDALVKDFPDDLKLDDTARLQDIVAAAKKAAADKAAGEKPPPAFFDIDPKQLELEKDSGVRQDTDTLKLGNKSEATADLMLPNADKFNKVQPFIQEKFDDLVGKLLDEADELDKKYQQIKLSTNQNNNDPGEIGKNGGAIASTGAVAATGNKKPPTTEGGGVARTGRQGARAFGMVADQVAPDMRGRDKALEGMQEAPDQKGTMKSQKTDDPATDFSTGVGGKKIESDESHFSLHDAGKWKDDMVGRMDKAQKKYQIVERQGEKMDPKVAAQLRDLASQQEQVIERLKAVKHELKNLYLPTDHLDDLEARLKVQLERLQEHPDADLFRLQLQTLDRLRGAAKVFRAASGNFAPSVPRDRRMQGRVVDAAPAASLPGYEEAIKGYYLRLVDQ